ncbi:hypothetical protein [Mycolicibacterium elephantis]|nr:hypothetical protein [Mycolicibacterium elephantis]
MRAAMREVHAMMHALVREFYLRAVVRYRGTTVVQNSARKPRL